MEDKKIVYGSDIQLYRGQRKAQAHCTACVVYEAAQPWTNSVILHPRAQHTCSVAQHVWSMKHSCFKDILL